MIFNNDMLCNTSFTNKMSLTYNEFKALSLTIRKEQYTKVKQKYPTHIPVLIDVRVSMMHVENRVIKFIIPPDITFAHMLIKVREKLTYKLPPEMALFIYINGTIPVMSQNISHIREICAPDIDGFYTVSVIGENAFGLDVQNVILKRIEDLSTAIKHLQIRISDTYQSVIGPGIILDALARAPLKM